MMRFLYWEKLIGCRTETTTRMRNLVGISETEKEEEYPTPHAVVEAKKQMPQEPEAPR